MTRKRRGVGVMIDEWMEVTKNEEGERVVEILIFFGNELKCTCISLCLQCNACFCNNIFVYCKYLKECQLSS